MVVSVLGAHNTSSRAKLTGVNYVGRRRHLTDCGLVFRGGNVGVQLVVAVNYRCNGGQTSRNNCSSPVWLQLQDHLPGSGANIMELSQIDRQPCLPLHVYDAKEVPQSYCLAVARRYSKQSPAKQVLPKDCTQLALHNAGVRCRLQIPPAPM